jgi:flagellar basal body-associated protein FliL
MKPLKIIINTLIFLLIAGFGYYIFHAILSEDKTITNHEEKQENEFVSLYKIINSFETVADIQCFAISGNLLFVVLENNISVFDLSGKHLRDFMIKVGARDIVVEDTLMFLLYPEKIELYDLDGKKQKEWEACSNNSDYCAMTTSKKYVFVTDAENKLIFQYEKQGRLVRFIKSPHGFIIPSYSFDIININDTLYCANSGRHQIESYTLDGEFIASFGKAGADTGAFSGCCNPVYLEQNPDGTILTSEKGNPRISSYGTDGNFRSVLFDSNLLGGGTTAYRMKVWEDNIYIAKKNRVTIFRMNEVHCEDRVASLGTQHIKNIFDEGELLEISVGKKFLRTAADGKNYYTKHDSLDMIISLDNRVNSKVATQFRIWATEKLHSYIQKGFTINRDRLKNPDQPFDYFEELEQIIQDICTRNRRFYLKITDIYATSIDYVKDAERTKTFLTTVQNKMHWVISEQTSDEIIYHRAETEYEHFSI